MDKDSPCMVITGLAVLACIRPFFYYFVEVTSSLSPIGDLQCHLEHFLPETGDAWSTNQTHVVLRVERLIDLDIRLQKQFYNLAVDKLYKAKKCSLGGTDSQNTYCPSVAIRQYSVPNIRQDFYGLDPFLPCTSLPFTQTDIVFRSSPV